MKDLSITLTCLLNKHALRIIFVHSYNFEVMYHLLAIISRIMNGWKYLREFPSHLDIYGFITSGFSADNDSPIYGDGHVVDLNSPNVKETL